MSITFKKTTSLAYKLEKGDQSPKEKKTLQIPDVSVNTIIKSQQYRQRLPPTLQTILKQMSSSQKLNHQNKENPAKNSLVGSKMRIGFLEVARSITSISFCLVCDAQMVSRDKNKNRQVYMCDCEHKFSFCESCLHHYTIYKIKNYEEVSCPQEGCPATLDIDSSFFKNLPQDIQKNYKKIKQFQLVAKDPNTKLCPSESCEGVIKYSVTKQNEMQCDACKNRYCHTCLLAVHEGPCESQQLLFFENNLQYRKCKKCGIIIQKDQGCNHMVCICKYEFCYVCGEPWSAAHYVDHGQDGQIVDGLCGQTCSGFCRFNCRCNLHYECFDRVYCSSFLKALVRVILLLTFILGMLLLFIFRDLLVILVIFIVTLITGLFAFSIEIIINLQTCYLRIIGIIFYPFLMIIGVAVAFREVFAPLVSRLCSNYCKMMNDGVSSICDI